ncbi:hypothetical protein HAZT_HAZT001475 [Hyalella azteca]|uniref:Cadherin domain-containing protein n=1 Tax=Hyalella azteca TaxID=294128 RepID=A0A6A0GPT3_HYAAZ|nr:hypothetical protein HAZT_HAZT001475 [Hyalella azteca]
MSHHYHSYLSSGTAIVTVTAHDADEPLEGPAPQLVYTLQKNVIEETSGRAIFTVERDSGKISTAVCCLDRERTGTYTLLLAATDAGGLQGSCTVVVEVRDVNDVPPQWARREWAVWAVEGQPASAVLATLPVNDPDRANELAFRGSSGWSDHERVGEARVILRVLDANDNAPVFVRQPPHTVTVREDLPVGSVVATLPAADLDAKPPIRLVQRDVWNVD